MEPAGARRSSNLEALLGHGCDATMAPGAAGARKPLALEASAQEGVGPESAETPVSSKSVPPPPFAVALFEHLFFLAFVWRDGSGPTR